MQKFLSCSKFPRLLSAGTGLIGHPVHFIPAPRFYEDVVWIPACAGMTKTRLPRFARNDKRVIYLLLLGNHNSHFPPLGCESYRLILRGGKAEPGGVTS